MRAYTFDAIRLTYNDAFSPPTNAATLQPAVVVATFEDGVDSLVFDVIEEAGDGEDIDDDNTAIRTDPIAITLDGIETDENDLEVTLANVLFSSGARSQILGLYDRTADAEYFIEVGGQPLDVTTAGAFNALAATIADVDSLPEVPIPLTEMSGFVSVEDVASDPTPPTDPVPTPGITRTGGDGNDVVTGSDGDDTLAGGSGDDRIEGRAGDDELRGEDGDDGLLGGAGDDTLFGGAGDDILAAADGNDHAFGGAGRDNLGGGRGDDRLHGGDDADTLGGGFGADSLEGQDGDDVVAGGAGNDTLDGGNGDDVMGASFGDDSVDGGAGDDDLGGGTGMDTIEAGAGNDSVGGGEGDDSILGALGDDFLAGGGRDDTVRGGAGDDTINGGAGSDMLFGGAGADLFVWNFADPGATDRVSDFDLGADRIMLRGVGGETDADRLATLDIEYSVAIADVGAELDFGTGEVANLDTRSVTTATLTYGSQEIEIEYELQTGTETLGVEDFVFL